MKNPLLNLFTALTTWASLRSYRGVFRFSDAFLQFPMATIDDYCAKRGFKLATRDLIKIDAEGSDVDVLLGAEKTIRKCGPQIAVTTYHEADHARRMIDYLRELRPDYTLRLKGFSFWTPLPNPVLLQASCVAGASP